MRIIGVFDHLADPLRAAGGAERTAVAHLRGLAREGGHDCEILTPAVGHAVTGTRRRRAHGVPIRTFRDLEELKAMILRARPAATISHLELVYPAASISHALGIPHVALLDSFECCEPSATEKRRWGIARDRAYLPADAVRRALQASTAVLACSRALAERVRQRHGVRVAVLYPRFDEGEILLRRQDAGRGSFITGICGQRYKGARLFLEMARRFARERFLLAGPVPAEMHAEFATQRNVVMSGMLPTRELLARSRVIVVPSQWEEPFGRIAVEAMANGIPVLASWTGGLKEVVGATALRVRNFREPAAWTRALRQLLSSEAARDANARSGRARAQRFVGSSAAQLDRLIRRARPPVRPDRRPTVALVGRASARTAFAMINARMSDALVRHVRVVRCEHMDEPNASAVDSFVHHDFSTDFSSLEAPSHGRWVVMRPWDFGPYPHAWVRKIRDECDALWVPSRWSKQLAVRGGIPARHVAVVPWGIDPSVFQRRGPRFPLPTRKRFRFLFVGAPVYRKGLDIALDAYTRGFTRSDDVCFVIKSNPDDLFYEGVGLLERIAALQARADAPEIIVVDEFLTEPRLASLYRTCTVGVYPYRAEGFALPILEGMACGLPAIVPNFGACLDYCPRDASFRVPVRRIRLPVGGSFRFNTLGFRETVDEVDFCEVPVDRLTHEMQRVARASRAELQRVSAAAMRIARGRFTWKAAADHALRALQPVLRRRVPVRIAATRRSTAKANRQAAVAIELLSRVR